MSADPLRIEVRDSETMTSSSSHTQRRMTTPFLVWNGSCGINCDVTVEEGCYNGESYGPRASVGVPMATRAQWEEIKRIVDDAFARFEASR